MDDQKWQWLDFTPPTSCCHLLVDSMRSTRCMDCTTIELNKPGCSDQSFRSIDSDFGPTDISSCFGNFHFLLQKLTPWMRRPRRTLSFPPLFSLTCVAYEPKLSVLSPLKSISVIEQSEYLCIRWTRSHLFQNLVGRLMAGMTVTAHLAMPMRIRTWQSFHARVSKLGYSGLAVRVLFS